MRIKNQSSRHSKTSTKRKDFGVKSHLPLQTEFQDCTQGKMVTPISLLEIARLLILNHEKNKKKLEEGLAIFSCMFLLL